MITRQEAEQISRIIVPSIQDVLREYDFGKYPIEPYAEFQVSFSSLMPTNNNIETALIWKWGHWGKPNFPYTHRLLIQQVQDYWPLFLASGAQHESANTYQWWKLHLNRNTAYITVAYITHLVHNQEPLPIIDQHNFRAMNNLIRAIRPQFAFKKKPSNWQDIQNLKRFMQRMCATIQGLSYSDLDKFLMMYGRNHVPR